MTESECEVIQVWVPIFKYNWQGWANFTAVGAYFSLGNYG